MAISNTLQPYVVADWSGGITDNYYSAPANCYSVLHNMLLDENAKPYTRYGLQAFQTQLPTAPTAQRISGIYIGSAPFGEPVFCIKDQLWGLNSSNTFTAVNSPSGSTVNALAGKYDTVLESAETWRQQIIAVSGPSALPARVWCSALTPTRVLNAYSLGLPALPSTPIVGIGSIAFTGALASNVTSNVTSVTNIGNLVVGEWAFYNGPSGGIYPVLTIEFISTGSDELVLSGYPNVPSSGTYNFLQVPNPFNTADGGGYYLYAFHYYYTFTDYNGTVWAEQGPHVQVGPFAGNFNYYSAAITLPVLTNSGFTNYDTSNIIIKIFRTLANGQTFFQVATVTNGTTTYTDTMVDSTLENNVAIYTDGGVLDWDPPMSGILYTTQVNDFFWYASQNTLTHSIQGAPGASPILYQQPIDQKIKGLSNVIGFPILFCDRSIYRVDGTFDEFGNGGFFLREISKTAGCISNRAIVPIPNGGTNGLVFPGNGGFYYTDGYQVMKISNNLNTRYQSWNNPNMVGAYDPIKNVVYWTVSTPTNGQVFPNDACVVLHLNFGISDKSVFTTLGAQSLYPTSLAFTSSSDADSRFVGRMLVGNAQSYFLYFDQNTFTDPNIQPNVFPSNFTRNAIIYRYESLGMNLGDESNRKWCTEITAELFNSTDLAIQFITRRDDESSWQTFSEIRSDGAIIWDYLNVEIPWDMTAPTSTDILHNWDAQPTIEGKRQFPSGRLRASRRQIGFTNSSTWIANSDSTCLATTNTTTKTVTLNTSGFQFPYSCEGYYIYFNTDGYTQAYRITAINSTYNVLTVVDPFSSLPSGSTLEWQIQGQRKHERANLLSYTVWSDKEGNTQAPYRGVAGLVNADFS